MSHQAAIDMMEKCNALGLISETEIKSAQRLVSAESPFAEALARAETLHVHLKVEDVAKLSAEELGAELVFDKPGFVKFAFPGGGRLICSNVRIAKEGEGPKRKPPYIDHFGVDMRDESDECRTLFDEVPAIAAERGWGHAAQGEDGKAVHCCYAQIPLKHWVYPDVAWDGLRVAIEFAFGEAVRDEAAGMDLRPVNPAMADVGGGCCGGEEGCC